MSAAEWARRDAAVVWHGFTQMSVYEDSTPVIVERGEGNYLYDVDGRRYLDAISSLWVITLGHADPELNRAAREQLDRISHSTLLGNGNTAAITLAESLREVVPVHEPHFLFASDGAAAVEQAIKIAFQYWHNLGETGAAERTAYLALGNAYHGDSVGSLSVGDGGFGTDLFNPLRFGVTHTPEQNNPNHRTNPKPAHTDESGPNNPRNAPGSAQAAHTPTHTDENGPNTPQNAPGSAQAAHTPAHTDESRPNTPQNAPGSARAAPKPAHTDTRAAPTPAHTDESRPNSPRNAPGSARVVRTPGYDDPDWVGKAIDALDEHQGRLAAAVIEPLVQGAAGILVTDPEQVAAFAAAVQARGILLICDEVATGFGRTGALFASERCGVRPDLMCLGKGITGGYLPLSATVAAAGVYEAFLGDDLGPRTFYHGHSYSGNALACAVAARHLELLFERGLLQRATAAGQRLGAALAPLATLGAVKEVRRRGLMAGVELDPPAGASRWGRKVCAAAVRAGVLLRPLGDVVVVMPPLSITDDEINIIASVLAESIQEVSAQEPRP